MGTVFRGKAVDFVDFLVVTPLFLRVIFVSALLSTKGRGGRGGYGSGGAAGRSFLRFRGAAEDDLGGIEELSCAWFGDDVREHGETYAGNEVACVLVSGKQRHGAAVGLSGQGPA